MLQIIMMATGRGTHTSILDTPLPQSVQWRLLSPLSPFDVRQRKLIDSDLQCHATSTPCETDNGNARVYDGWAEDLRFDTIKVSAPENVKTDMYKRTTVLISKRASSSPTDSLLGTIDTLITEKLAKLSTTMGHVLVAITTRKNLKILYQDRSGK